MEAVDTELNGQWEEEQEESQVVEKVETIDFKMVTFSLGGKEYGIDIMKVKEISKAGKFTYVPNSIPFVKGVYNLRGDIISVIDLRIMFNIEVEKKSKFDLENLIYYHIFNLLELIAYSRFRKF